jgi:Predicted membrane protein
MDQPVEQHAAQAADTVQAQSMPPLAHAGQKNVLMAALSYLGVLVIIPYIFAKGDSFVKFHVRQGVVLFGIEIVLWVITTFLGPVWMFFFWPLWMLWQLLNLGIFILAIVGIVHAVQGNEKELPLVGHLAVHVPL